MKIPLFPLDLVLFPGAALPLHIFEERYRELTRVCLAEQTPFGVVCARQDGLCVIGCTAHIVKVLQRYDDGRLDILCEGVQRFEIEMLDNSQSYLQAEVDCFDDDGPHATRAEREECIALHFEVLELTESSTEHTHFDLAGPVSFQLAWALPADLSFKQTLLSSRSDAERTERLREFYETMLPKLRRGALATRVAGRNGHVM